ncbi:MAG: hypothetical protein WCK65_00090 [Rhodospirillaceae bacterium]
MELGLLETTGILILAALAFIWSNLEARREVDPLRVRMWSPVLVMGAAAVVVILMLAHLLSLLTGAPFRGGGF